MWPFKPNIERMKRGNDARGLIKAILSKDEDIKRSAKESLVEIAYCSLIEELYNFPIGFNFPLLAAYRYTIQKVLIPRQLAAG